MRIGILGGAFDPVHRGHLRLARAAQRSLRLDRLLLIPTRVSPHKRRTRVAPPRHRLRMLELSVRDLAGLDVCDLELRRAGRSYTVDTLRILRRRRPRADWFIVIGADNAAILDRWKRIDRLADWATFAVVERPGVRRKPPRVPGLRVRTIPMASWPHSSSEIRDRVRKGLPVGNLVPPPVADYIIRHKLYGARPR